MSYLIYGVSCVFWILAPSNPGKTPAVLFQSSSAPAVEQSAAPAPPAARTAQPEKEIFVSWGYNGDHYAKSDLRIEQPSAGSDFMFGGVQARDSSPWGNIIGHSLFVPQYNVRAGVFFNARWGLEVALDHMKWIVKQDQVVPMTGTLNAAPVDTPVTLTTDVLRYQLNNGANPVFINAVRRVQLRGEPKRTGSISFLAKAGGGPAMPHTENELFGQPNDRGFQFFHGWDVDAAAAIRLHAYKRLYIEAEEKLVYARYFGVKVDRGTAAHSVKASEFIVSGGFSFR